MPKMLSQDEVDALLDAVATDGEAVEGRSVRKGEESEKHSYTYDFKRPQRFSKDQLQLLRSIHEGFARQIATTLTNFMMEIVDASLVSVDQVTYNEFLSLVPDATCFAVLSLAPMEGKAILELNPSLAIPIIDRQLGGDGSPTDISRGLTELEQSLIHRVLDKILDVWRDMWRHIVQIDPQVESIEANPRLAQVVTLNESVMLFMFEIKFRKASGIMKICIPFGTIEPALRSMEFERTRHVRASSIDPKDAEKARHLLLESAVPISAILGRAVLKVRELVNLEVGDIVLLDTAADEPLEVMVGDKVEMKGRPGSRKGSRCIVVTGLTGGLKELEESSQSQSSAEEEVQAAADG